MDFHCLWNVQDKLIPYCTYTTACLLFLNNFFVTFILTRACITEESITVISFG